MDQIKNLRSVNARNYVFIMFQMISIWNWQHVPSTQADQSETYKNNQWNDLLVEQQRSLVLFHMLSDWHFKHLINFILIPRFDPSLIASWYFTSFIYTNFKTILSNTICVPVLLSINIGFWHQQHVASVMILSPSHSMIIQFSTMIKIKMKSSLQFFTFIRTSMLVWSEQPIFRISWLIFHAWRR